MHINVSDVFRSLNSHQHVPCDIIIIITRL